MSKVIEFPGKKKPPEETKEEQIARLEKEIKENQSYIDSSNIVFNNLLKTFEIRLNKYRNILKHREMVGDGCWIVEEIMKAMQLVFDYRKDKILEMIESPPERWSSEEENEWGNIVLDSSFLMSFLNDFEDNLSFAGLSNEDLTVHYSGLLEYVKKRFPKMNVGSKTPKLQLVASNDCD